MPDSDEEREIIAVFRNLKGFDGMFLLHELLQQQREVVDQLTVGGNVLSLNSLTRFAFYPCRWHLFQPHST